MKLGDIKAKKNNGGLQIVWKARNINNNETVGLLRGGDFVIIIDISDSDTRGLVKVLSTVGVGWIDKHSLCDL